MDVLILTIGFRPNIGGLETHLTDLTNELKKQMKVMVVTLFPITTNNTNAKIVEREKNLLIWRIPWYGGGLFYKLLKHPLLEFFYLIPPLTFGLIVALIRYPSIKVIHAQGLTGVISAGILGKMFKKRIIVSTHFVYNFKDNFFAKFSKLAYDLADRVLCITTKSAQEMRELGIPEQKIGRCAYWIDLNLFKPLDKVSAKKTVGWGKRFSILFTGRLVMEKGILELMSALKDISEDINLYVIGDGPLKERVLKIGKKYKNFSYLGIVDNSQMPIYYNAANIVVIPSYEETLGRVGIEALACSTPVIATDRGGIREVVSERVGIFIDLSPKNIAKSVNALYKNRKLYNSLKNNARPHVLKTYSSKNANVFIKEYNIDKHD